MPLIHNQVALQSSPIMPRSLLVLPETGVPHPGWAAGDETTLPSATGPPLPGSEEDEGYEE